MGNPNHNSQACHQCQLLENPIQLICQLRSGSIGVGIGMTEKVVVN